MFVRQQHHNQVPIKEAWNIHCHSNRSVMWTLVSCCDLRVMMETGYPIRNRRDYRVEHDAEFEDEKKAAACSWNAVRQPRSHQPAAEAQRRPIASIGWVYYVWVDIVGIEKILEGFLENNMKY